MSGDVRIDGKSMVDESMTRTEDSGETTENVTVVSSGLNESYEVSGDGAFEIVTQVPCNVDTPVLNKNTENAVDVVQTTPENVIAGLKEKVSQLEVELRFMHGENDNIKIEQKEKLAELTETYEEKIRGYEKSLRDAGEKNDELTKEMNTLITKHEVRCSDIKTLEAAQTNLESLLQNKDEIIESQKLIIGGVRKKISDTDGLKSKSVIRNLEAEREDLVNTIKMKDSQLGEYSEQVENLKTQLREKETEISKGNSTAGSTEITAPNCDMSRMLQEKTALLSKTEELVYTKQDLLDAKDEIIRNLKTIISSGESKSMCKSCEESKNKDLTSNSTRSEEESAPVATVKNGVKESCEFIQIHATNGAIMDPLLLWVNIQRKMHPEDKWKADAVKKFADTEITDAKEILWRVAGDKHLGKIVKRKGAAKSTSEMNDICAAFKTLAEKDKVPLFLSTCSMIARTPIYADSCTTCDPSSLNERLSNISESIGTIMSTLEKRQNNENDNPSSREVEGKIDTPLGETIPITEITGSGFDAVEHEENNEPFEIVTKRKQKKKSAGSASISADTDLVIFGLPKNVTDESLKQVLSENNVKINDPELLTKYEAARSFAYKVRVTKKDAEKLHALTIWPERGGVRPYTLTYRKGSNPGRKTETEQSNQVPGMGTSNMNDTHSGQRQDISMNFSNVGGKGMRNMIGTNVGQQQGYPVHFPSTGGNFVYRLNPMTNGIPGQSPSASNNMVFDTRMPYDPRAQEQFPTIPDLRITRNLCDADKWSTADIPQSSFWDHPNTGTPMYPDSQANRRVRQVRFVDRVGTDRFSVHQQ